MADNTKLGALIADLRGAVAERLERTNAAAPRYRLAAWGATRVRHDGVIQIGRRDAQVLRELAEQRDATEPAGEQAGDKWRTRASAALHNLTTAEVHHLTNAVPNQHFEGSRLAQAVAAKTVAAGAVGAALTAVEPARTVLIQPGWDATRNTVGRVVPAIAHAMGSAPTPGQLGAVAGGAMAIPTGVAALRDWNRSRADVFGAGVESAWSRAHDAELRQALGVDGLVPGLEESPDARTAKAAVLAQDIGFYTERDERSVLTDVVKADPGYRGEAMVDVLADNSAAAPATLSPGARAQATDELRAHAGGQTSEAVLKAASTLTKQSGLDQAETFPKAGLITRDQVVAAGQNRASSAAFSAIAAAGPADSAAGQDGARGQAANSAARSTKSHRIE